MNEQTEHWGEFLRLDDEFWRGIRRSLIGFIAIDPATKNAVHLGAGFTVAGAKMDGDDKDYVIAMTARHVLEHAYRYQDEKKFERRARNSPDVLFPLRVSVAENQLRAIWMGDHGADVLRIRHVNWLNGQDLALVLLEPQDHSRKTVPSSVAYMPFDVRMPPIGTVLHFASLTDYNLEGEFLVDGGISTIRNRPVLRWGKVLAHLVEAMGHRGPCFTMSAPTVSGMSGGFVYWPGADGTELGVCGIISSSPESSIPNQLPETTVVSIRCALGLEMPVSGDHPRKLVEFLCRGELRDITKRPDQFRWSANADGGITIQIL